MSIDSESVTGVPRIIPMDEARSILADPDGAVCGRPGPAGATCLRPPNHPRDFCSAVGMEGPDDAPLTAMTTNVITWEYQHTYPAIGRAPARPPRPHWEDHVTADTTDFSPAEWNTVTLLTAAIDMRFGAHYGEMFCQDPDHAPIKLHGDTPTATLIAWAREHWECHVRYHATPMQDIGNVER